MMDTFLRCFQGFKRFNRKARLRTWLFRVSERAAADYYRKKDPLRGGVTLVEIDQAQVVTAQPASLLTVPGPYLAAACNERHQNLHRVLKQLRAGHQRVIILREFEGFSVAETAEVLQTTEAAVKMRFARAMRNLENLLRSDAYFQAQGTRV